MVTDIFAVIADRTRRDILDTLRTGDKAVGELVEALAASQPTVSKHLKVLRDAGLVTTRAQGQKRFYALRLEPLDEVGGWLAGLRTTAPSPAAAAVPPAAAAGPVPAEAPPVEPAAPGPRPGEEAALVPAAVVPAPAERLEARPEGSRPAQIQRTVERAAARATELMANLPKFGRRK
ncbi:helix-turn-helix transcriptional regulator [Sinomonas atrocyanea]|jgi:DNA-binding transcriptional ArsR family regulator|uniref:ArsR/SmtB family transcription factor n=1 Tax=Sinomonas atrocyanea TaxID=37927 RepID=UPI002782AF21|nr:metalloregulator ArsR/SmtB family transcription factor [Sinomonas atrocyanea]MDQ0259014.1 DNA-binding transcriptional ArsR family regulator [Sinomonas atrocyanea]MDR6621879.1 DNA-binding transcriptional ArsR family regulator [Sinomonas atrocyanea]